MRTAGRPALPRTAALCTALGVAITAALLAAAPAAAQTALRLRPLAAATRHLEEGPLLRPAGVTWDPAAGEIWIADSGNDLIGAFTPDGVPVFATDGGGTLREPKKVVLGPRGELWVLDSDRTRIARLDWRGAPLPSPELPGLPAEPSLGAVAFDRAGNLWVGENLEGRIHVFDPAGRPLFRFGGRGGDEGRFLSIVDLAISGDQVVVLDAVGLAVQLFNRRGEFQRAWGEHALGDDNFSLPQGVALDGRGHVIVVDALRHEIKFFDLEGKLLGRFGGYGFRPGQVRFPVDVAVGAPDRLFVAEKANGRVQEFAIEEVAAPAPAR